MKKNVKKLSLHRETLAILETRTITGGAVAAIQTSCTYPCGCPTGCSDEQACMDPLANA
jgi:hypothetical protein